MRRILAIDLGDRRVGIALSDALGYTAQGLKTIDRRTFPHLMAAIAQLVKEYEVSRVLVGLPQNMDGSYGPRAHAAELFAERLQKALKLPVELIDERLTTVQATRILHTTGKDARHQRDVIDTVAATLILEQYLARARNEGTK
ncbi:MAG: Holliday junction resolvase RuvX [Firmicutes bacterium]|nr:Holliday junction resolvase RuvX [Bacillota bacterium]